MFTERTSVGLDVHARSVAAAAIDGVTGELLQVRLTPSYEHIQSWVEQLHGPVAVTYEAGPTGFGLYRALTGAGIRCEVAAPSKLHRPAGGRVKTDAKDAVHLARLLRVDEITAVAIPTVAQEAARDLVRAREDCRRDLMSARHRRSKLLLRHGIVYYDGRAWTGPHDAWLRQARLPTPATRMAFDNDYEAVLSVQARRDRLDAAIEHDGCGQPSSPRWWHAWAACAASPPSPGSPWPWRSATGTGSPATPSAPSSASCRANTPPAPPYQVTRIRHAPKRWMSFRILTGGPVRHFAPASVPAAGPPPFDEASCSISSSRIDSRVRSPISCIR